MVRPSLLAAALLVLVTACGGDGAPATPPPGATAVSFETADELTIEGRLFGQPATRGVVLAHMFPGDQDDWSAFAARLAEQGYLTLTLNFRGYGGSEGPKKIDRIDQDLLAAVKFIRGRGVTDVYLIGASMGATASLIVAGDAQVRAVVSLSGADEFKGLDARPVLGRITAPVLFIASEGDGSALETARTLAESTGGKAEVMELEGSRHGTDILEGPDAGRVGEAILAFLNAN